MGNALACSVYHGRACALSAKSMVINFCAALRKHVTVFLTRTALHCTCFGLFCFAALRAPSFHNTPKSCCLTAARESLQLAIWQSLGTDYCQSEQHNTAAQR